MNAKAFIILGTKYKKYTGDILSHGKIKTKVVFGNENIHKTAAY